MYLLGIGVTIHTSLVVSRICCPIKVFEAVRPRQGYVYWTQKNKNTGLIILYILILAPLYLSPNSLYSKS